MAVRASACVSSLPRSVAASRLVALAAARTRAKVSVMDKVAGKDVGRAVGKVAEAITSRDAALLPRHLMHVCRSSVHW